MVYLDFHQIDFSELLLNLRNSAKNEISFDFVVNEIFT